MAASATPCELQKSYGYGAFGEKGFSRGVDMAVDMGGNGDDMLMMSAAGDDDADGLQL